MKYFKARKYETPEDIKTQAEKNKLFTPDVEHFAKHRGHVKGNITNASLAGIKRKPNFLTDNK